MGNHQFVTFRIDENLAGIDILKVREINRVLDITPVPHAREYVLGLINLRGQTVTVFDLGIRLGLLPRDITPESHNLILKRDTVGLLVDGIGDVIEAEDDDIRPPPANIGEINGEFVESVVKVDDEILMVLSSEKILEHRASEGKA